MTVAVQLYNISKNYLSIFAFNWLLLLQLNKLKIFEMDW